MSTVTIAATNFFSYADQTEADAYLLASPDFALWDANDADTKGRYLVSSTRVLNQQTWLPDYDTQAERELVQDIQDACILLANAVSNGGTAILGTSGSEAEQKRLKVGELEIENFRSFSGASFTGSKATQFPNAVLALLRPYLGNTGASIGNACSSGTDGVSVADDDYSVI